MGSKFCVKFQRAPLKFHTKFWTHTPQNMHFTVFYFCVWVTISLNCDVISLSETGPRWYRYSTKKCLPDSHLPFVYVGILSISPLWRTGETNLLGKTSKILFWIVMATFGKSFHRFWLHGLKNQSIVGSWRKFSKMAATWPVLGHWVGNTSENFSVSDSGKICSILLNQIC